MKKKISVLLILFMLVATGVLVAQSGTVTISGLVVDAETRDPLAGANVAVRGKTVGSATNLQGEFSFRTVLDEPHELVVSFMGYKRQALTVRPGDSITGLLFELEPDVIGTEAVVVTALGLTREERALGYAQQQIDGAQLTEVAESNIVANLSGKVAGVSIVGSSGMIGASARIQIRGVSSITGNNQPLFVVDGVPIANDGRGAGASGGVVDFGNGAADINPNDIASINVLKGANAAALYGSRALNGVVEITTKSGKGAGMLAKRGIGISYSNHIVMRQADVVFKYQNKYGQGSLDYSIPEVDAEIASIGQFSYFDGDGGGINDGTDESWGPPMDGYLSEYYQQWYGNHPHIVVQGQGQPLLIKQFDSPFADGTISTRRASWDRTPTPWVSNPSNVQDFFETGLTMEHNLSVYGGDMGTNFRLSFTHQDETGVMPNTDQKRNSVYLSGNLQMTDRLSVSGIVNYINTNNGNLPFNGYVGFNPMQSISQWFGRQVKWDWLSENYQNAEGRPENWNLHYHDNPWWIMNRALNSRLRNRVFGNISFDYDVLAWLKATFRVGTDLVAENRNYKGPKYSVNDIHGSFSDNTEIIRETNYDFFVRGSRMVSDFNITGLVGANYRDNYYKWNQTAVAELIIPNLYSVSNAQSVPTTGMNIQESKTASIYGRIGFDYKDFLFIEATGRNDWSSTLPEDNRSYFYPSVGGSFVFTEFFDIDEHKLFGKIRASWAKVGNSASPYQLAATYNANQAWLGVPLLTLQNQMANNTLKPEEKSSIEFGTDLKFLRNRLGLSLTYYKENTINQIMGVAVSAASGFTTKMINAGEIENSGLEVTLNATPVKTNKLSWDVDINWAKNNNKVIELIDGVDNLTLWQSWGGLQAQARVGGSWGDLYGYAHQTHNGKPVVSTAANWTAGLHQREAAPSVLGNVLPDWTAGVRNSISYGNFRLSALVDMSWGGDVWSVSNMFGYYAGVSYESVYGNDETKIVAANGDGRTEGLIIDGYKLVDGNYVENDIVVSMYNYSIFKGWPGLGGHANNIYDATWVKLRSVNLSYRIPSSLTNKLGILGATVALEGRNLFILYKKVPNIDPETSFASGGAQGSESNQFPPVRLFGFSLKFDL